MTYQEQYEAWYLRKQGGDAAASLEPWHRNAARFLPNLNGLRVLEVGCGTGAFAGWLAAHYPSARIVGVDFSNVAIETANRASLSDGTRLEFLTADAQDLPFAAASFDMVISCECLEHVPAPAVMLAEVARVLKPAGKFLITTENYFNGMVLAWAMSSLRNQPFDSGSGAQPHENFFLFWRVRRLIEAAGLRVEQTYGNHFQWILLPKIAPHRLRTDNFSSALLNRLFRPFGRHFLFYGSRARVDYCSNVA